MARKKSNSEYAKELKRLRAKFPQLKEIRAKKNFSASDKAKISRAAYYNKIAATPKRERPEKLRDYQLPLERNKPDSYYKREARRLAPLLDKPEKFREYSSASKLTPAQKAAITKKANLVRGESGIFKLTKTQAAKLPKDALLGPGIKAIRLRNTGPDARLRILKGGKMSVTSGGRKWVYDPIGSDETALEEAAAEYFEQGATQIHFWTFYGRAGTAALDIEDFVFQLRSKYMQYLDASREKYDAEWLLGLAVLFE